MILVGAFLAWIAFEIYMARKKAHSRAEITQLSAELTQPEGDQK